MFSTNYHDNNYDGNHNSNINVMTKGRTSSSSTTTSTSSEENDNSTTTSTTMTTSTSLYSSIRGECRNEAESCSSDEDTELMSPWMSFEDNELQYDDAANQSSTSKGSSSSSSSSSSSRSTYQYIDLRYTMISNLTFLAGASIQTYTAICDLKESRADALMDDDDDSTDDDYIYTFGDDTYYVLYSLGPLLYIINACIDIRWQLDLTSSPISLLSSFWCWCCVWYRRSEESSPSDNIDLTLEEQQEQYEEVKATTQESDGNFDNDEISLSTFRSTTASQYESERIETYWGLVVAFIFCAGALFEFYSTFLDDYYEDLDDDYDDDTYLIKEEKKRPWYVSNYKMDFIGMHLYLLSGIIDLWSKRNSCRSDRNNISCDIRRLFFCFGRKCNDEDSGKTTLSREISSSSSLSLSSNRIAEFCIFLGTILFVLGTLLDCTISILYDPEQRHVIDPHKTIVLDEVVLDTCSLISSLLWNVDAILYIIADILLYSFHVEDSKARRWLFGSDQKRSATDTNKIPRQLFEQKQQQQQELSSNNETIPLILDPTSTATATTTQLNDIAVINYSTL